MEVNPKDTSTPELFWYLVQDKWVEVPRVGGAIVKRFFKEGLSIEDAYEKDQVLPLDHKLQMRTKIRR